jgi:two-component system NarL family sensor kinase
VLGGAVQNINSKKKLIIFRIIQEALNNVLKHAEANKIDLNVNFQETKLEIDVIDNGKGFNVNDENTMGLGLQNIIKRASLSGGKVVVESKINSGTTINLNMPYE